MYHWYIKEQGKAIGFTERKPLRDVLPKIFHAYANCQIKNFRLDEEVLSLEQVKSVALENKRKGFYVEHLLSLNTLAINDDFLFTNVVMEYLTLDYFTIEKSRNVVISFQDSINLVLSIIPESLSDNSIIEYKNFKRTFYPCLSLGEIPNYQAFMGNALKRWLEKQTSSAFMEIILSCCRFNNTNICYLNNFCDIVDAMLEEDDEHLFFEFLFTSCATTAISNVCFERLMKRFKHFSEEEITNYVYRLEVTEERDREKLKKWAEGIKFLLTQKPNLCLNFTIKSKLLELLRELNPTDFQVVAHLDNKEITICYRNNDFVYKIGEERTYLCINGHFTTQIFEDPDGNIYCPECAKEIGFKRGYHSHTVFRPMERGVTDIPSEKSLYGLELEGFRRPFDQPFSKVWKEKMMPLLYGGQNLGKVERDGSLNDGEGDETITQPLSKRFLLSEDFKQFFSVWSELYYTNRYCGLHIHVDRDCLSDEQWSKLCKIIYKLYPQFNDKKIWRDEQHYCSLSALEGFSRTNGSPFNHREMFSHYSAVSISEHTNKTVEFRFFDGTDDYDVFMRNVKSIMVLMDHVDEIYESEKIKVEI